MSTVSDRAVVNAKNTDTGWGLSELAIAAYIFSTIAFSEGELLNMIAKVFLIFSFLIDFLSGKKAGLNNFMVAATTFFAVSVASLLWTAAPEASSERVWTFIYQFACYFALSNLLLWKPKRIEFSLTWIVLSSILSGIYVVVIEGVTFHGNRTQEGVIASGQLALSCALAIAICIYRFAKNKKVRYILAILPLAVFLLATSSRRGFIIIVLFIFLFALFSARDALRKIGVAVVGAVLSFSLYTLVLTNPILYKFVGQRIQSLVDFTLFGGGSGIGDASVRGRDWLIAFGIDLFHSSPWIGNGIGAFTQLFSQQHGSWYTSADNNYVELLADLGILGILAYYIPLIIFLIKNICRVTEKSLLFRFAIASIVAMTIVDYTMVWFFSKVGMMMILIIYQITLEERTRELNVKQTIRVRDSLTSQRIEDRIE